MRQLNRRAALGLGTAAAAGAVLGKGTAASALDTQEEAAGRRHGMRTGWCHRQGLGDCGDQPHARPQRPDR